MNQHSINGQNNYQDLTNQALTNQNPQNMSYQANYSSNYVPLQYLSTIVYLPHQFLYPTYVSHPYYTDNIINQSNLVPNFPHTQINYAQQSQLNTQTNQSNYQESENNDNNKLCKNEFDNPHQQQLLEQIPFQIKKNEEDYFIQSIDSKEQSQEQQYFNVKSDKTPKKIKSISKKKSDSNKNTENLSFYLEKRNETQIQSFKPKQLIIEEQQKNKNKQIENGKLNQSFFINDMNNNYDFNKNEDQQIQKEDNDLQQNDLFQINKISFSSERDTQNENKKYSNETISNILLKEQEQQFDLHDLQPSETFNYENHDFKSSKIQSSKLNTIKIKKINNCEQKQKNKEDQQQQNCEINEIKKKLLQSLKQSELDLLQNAVSINRQNANKNLIKSFQKYVNNTLKYTYEYQKQQQQKYYFKICYNEEININENPTQNELQKFLKNFNKFISSKTYTNLHIKQIIQNRIYGQILFADFLSSYSMTWLEQANVLNKKQYKAIINFYKWCCEKQELLIFLNDINTIQSISIQDGKNKFHELNYLLPEVHQQEEKEDNNSFQNKDSLKQEQDQK